MDSVMITIKVVNMSKYARASHVDTRGKRSTSNV